MRKIPTLFVRDFATNPRYLTRALAPGCAWVADGEGVATRKYDGTCVMLDERGQWWARREVRRGRNPPPGFQPIEHDADTGKTVGWEPIDNSGFAAAHRQALDAAGGGAWVAGTYELCGPKVNGNPEELQRHTLIRHADAQVLDDVPRDFDGLAGWLAAHAYEGVVFHHPDGRMAKIKRRDFPRP